MMTGKEYTPSKDVKDDTADITEQRSMYKHIPSVLTS